MTAAMSPSSLPQSPTGRFQVSTVEAALVAAHDQLEPVLGGSVRQLAHAEVVDDEQGHAGHFGHVVRVGVGERGLCELFKEGVRFDVDDAVALLDGGPAASLREMPLAGSGPDQEYPYQEFARMLNRTARLLTYLDGQN